METARAFAEDIKLQKEALNLDPNVTVDGINIKDDEDANNRQSRLTNLHLLVANANTQCRDSKSHS